MDHSMYNRNAHIAIYVLLPLLMLGVATASLWAQGDSRVGRIEELRTNYITRELDLSKDEMGKFMPVYQQYQNDLHTLRQNYMPRTDEDVSKLTVDRQMEFEQKKLDLKKQYVPQFERAIGHENLNRLVHAEENFKRNVIRAIHNHQIHGGPIGKMHKMDHTGPEHRGHVGGHIH